MQSSLWRSFAYCEHDISSLKPTNATEEWRSMRFSYGVQWRKQPLTKVTKYTITNIYDIYYKVQFNVAREMREKYAKSHPIAYGSIII